MIFLLGWWIQLCDVIQIFLSDEMCLDTHWLKGYKEEGRRVQYVKIREHEKVNKMKDKGRRKN